MALAATEASAQRKFSFAYDQPRTTAYGIAADIFDAALSQSRDRIRLKQTRVDSE